MLKQLALASATAAIALTAAADFSTGTFDLISDAEAETSREAAQPMKLKPILAKPQRPGTKSPPGPSGPQMPGGMQAELLPDLYFDFYPATAAAGHSHFCSKKPAPNKKPEYAVVKVYSKGNKTVGAVSVRFWFLTNQQYITKSVFMDTPNAVKTVKLKIPDAAWSSDGKAFFNILIDAPQSVAENDESNNATGGHCLDPKH